MDYQNREDKQAVIITPSLLQDRKTYGRKGWGRTDSYFTRGQRQAPIVDTSDFIVETREPAFQPAPVYSPAGVYIFGESDFGSIKELPGVGFMLGCFHQEAVLRERDALHQNAREYRAFEADVYREEWIRIEGRDYAPRDPLKALRAPKDYGKEADIVEALYGPFGLESPKARSWVDFHKKVDNERHVNPHYTKRNARRKEGPNHYMRWEARNDRTIEDDVSSDNAEVEVLPKDLPRSAKLYDESRVEGLRSNPFANNPMLVGLQNRLIYEEDLRQIASSLATARDYRGETHVLEALFGPLGLENPKVTARIPYRRGADNEKHVDPHYTGRNARMKEGPSRHLSRAERMELSERGVGFVNAEPDEASPAKRKGKAIKEKIRRTNREQGDDRFLTIGSRLVHTDLVRVAYAICPILGLLPENYVPYNGNGRCDNGVEEEIETPHTIPVKEHNHRFENDDTSLPLHEFFGQRFARAEVPDPALRVWDISKGHKCIVVTPELFVVGHYDTLEGHRDDPFDSSHSGEHDIEMAERKVV